MTPALVLVAATLLALPKEVPQGGPIVLVHEDDVKELCLALRPVERVTFEGDVEGRAKARQAFAERREQLRAAEYAVDVPWGGFRVLDWDPVESTLTLSTEQPFRAFAGALALFDSGREELELEAEQAALADLKSGLAKGAVSLALVFRPAEEEGSPCAIGKMKNYTLAVDLVSAELRGGGKALARATGEGFEARGKASGTPTVTIGEAHEKCEDCPAELVASVQKVKPAVEKCYADGLSRKPTLDGSVVFSLTVGQDGKVAAKETLADSVQDDALVACLKTAIAGAKSAAKGKKGMVSIQLERR